MCLCFCESIFYDTYTHPSYPSFWLNIWLSVHSAPDRKSASLEKNIFPAMKTLKPFAVPEIFLSGKDGYRDRSIEADTCETRHPKSGKSLTGRIPGHSEFLTFVNSREFGGFRGKSFQTFKSISKYLNQPEVEALTLILKISDHA
jgi:hypothetical protein